MRRIKTIFILSTFLLASDMLQAQCAMCRAVLESDAAMEGTRVSEGINTGILYLMGFPYLLLFAVVLYIFREQISTALKRA